MCPLPTNSPLPSVTPPAPRPEGIATSRKVQEENAMFAQEIRGKEERRGERRTFVGFMDNRWPLATQSLPLHSLHRFPLKTKKNWPRDRPSNPEPEGGRERPARPDAKCGRTRRAESVRKSGRSGGSGRNMRRGGEDDDDDVRYRVD